MMSDLSSHPDTRPLQYTEGDLLHFARHLARQFTLPVSDEELRDTIAEWRKL